MNEAEVVERLRTLVRARFTRIGGPHPLGGSQSISIVGGDERDRIYRQIDELLDPYPEADRDRLMDLAVADLSEYLKWQVDDRPLHVVDQAPIGLPCACGYGIPLAVLVKGSWYRFDEPPREGAEPAALVEGDKLTCGRCGRVVTFSPRSH